MVDSGGFKTFSKLEIRTDDVTLETGNVEGRDVWRRSAQHDPLSLY